MLSFTADAEPLVRWAIGMRPPVKALSVQAEIRILMVSLPQSQDQITTMFRFWVHSEEVASLLWGSRDK